MPRLIDADETKETLRHLLYETAMNNSLDIADIYEDIAEKRLDTWIELIPTADVEPTEEQVKEYCRKRCLVIVNSELFNEMKARSSAVPVVRCKECKFASLTYDGECKYCQKWKEKHDGESVSLYLDGDFYCAFGERREDAKTD